MKNGTEKNGKAKMGIKAKLISALLPLVICVVGIVVAMVYSNTRSVLLESSEEYVATSTQSVVNQVRTWMKETITALVSERDTMQYMDMDEDEMLAYVKHTADTYDAFPAGIYVAISATGELIHSSFIPGPEYNIYMKPWYNDGLVSEEFIFGEVYFDEDSQSYVVGASGMMKDGSGKVIGVAAADIYLNAISEIVQEVQIEETGGVFLIDGNTNTIIGHKDSSVVGQQIDSLEGALYTYAAGRISNQSYGLDETKGDGGQNLYVDVEVIPDSNWIAVSYVPEVEILSELNVLTNRVVLVALIGCLVLIFAMERLIHLIVKPVKSVSGALDSMTRGDFTVSVEVRTSDEIGIMAHGMRRFIRIMGDTIRQITEVSHTLAKQAESSSRISADLSGAASSMEEAGKGVEELMESVHRVSENAQHLSETIADTGERGQLTSKQMKAAVSSSEQGIANVQDITGCMDQLSTKMQLLKESAVKMDSSIDNINNMVQMIEEIAEQTNLLALNASIEAARAGEAGRGFAVVASEIGSLAATSKKAVGDISKLTAEISGNIRQTVDETRDSDRVLNVSHESVEKAKDAFNQIFDTMTETDKTVNEMVSGIQEVIQIAETVMDNSKEQTDLSETILVSIHEMEENAHTVSEHSQEMRADVEGLKSNAALLDSLMGTFKI